MVKLLLYFLLIWMGITFILPGLALGAIALLVQIAHIFI